MGSERFLDHMTIEQMEKHMERLFELADQGHRSSDLGMYGNKVDAEIRRRRQVGEN